jgi:GT2 family glycosyltransferase
VGDLGDTACVGACRAPPILVSDQSVLGAGRESGAIQGPTFSVMTTVFDTEPEHLRACLESVDAQTEASWEHIVVDDCSQRAEVGAVLAEFGQSSRRTVLHRSVNGGIVAASNDALAAASGDFVVLLDHDDVLASDALAEMSARLTDGADVYYSDHDLLRPDGRRASPMFKPDFSLERLRNHNYITHLVVARRTVVERIGGFRPGFDGAQDHDLLLRLAEVAAPFVHVPEVLLHWRQSPASVASNAMNKPDAYGRGARAVADHLSRSGIDATVERGEFPGVYRIRRRVEGRPKVSVVIPTRGSRGEVWGVDRIFVHDAVRSLLQPGGSSNDGDRDDRDDRGDRDDRDDRDDGRASEIEIEIEIEIVAVIDEGTDPLVERGLRSLAGDALVIVPFDRPFNFAEKINAGVAASNGDYIMFLNDDTELIERTSLSEMVGLAQDPTIGMVGAKLLFEDGRLQHGGHVYHGGYISHALLDWPGDHPGPYRLLAVERECSGVTAAAAVMRREVFDSVGGMSEELAINYNDVDFSLRMRRAGLRVVWTPHASWYHFEQRSGAHPILDDEVAVLQRLWPNDLDRDPFYNPNLAPGRTDWLELPLRSGAPPYEVLDDGRVSWG